MQKSQPFIIRGMQRDLSVSKFSSEYAYENKNIRIMSADDNTLLSIVNEKGNAQSSILNIGNSLKGVPIGQAVINNDLILFTAGERENINITAEDEEIDTIYSEIEFEEQDIIDVSTTDSIYKLWFNSTNQLEGKLLYRGNLSFDYKNPIETLIFYENEELKKVYWTDGINQPRVINIAAPDKVISKWNNNSFDFVPQLKFKETISITKNKISSGIFAAGTIQYAFSYFNKYGSESSIFYISPMYYTSYIDRGAEPGEAVGNSFDITIEDMDPLYDYVRIYSIQRTSIDDAGSVKIVADVSTDSIIEKYYGGYRIEKHEAAAAGAMVFDSNENQYVNLESIPADLETSSGNEWSLQTNRYTSIKFSDNTFIDFNKGRIVRIAYYGNDLMVEYDDQHPALIVNKSNSYIITDTGKGAVADDPMSLLYIGGEVISAGTMSHKDNVLFLGDIKLKRPVLDSKIKEEAKNIEIDFVNEQKITTPITYSGYYFNDNQLQYSSNDIKTFKYLEYYRFGIQAQHYSGKWSEPIFINDVKNTTSIESTFYEPEYSKHVVAEATIADNIASQNTLIKDLVTKGYIRIRPVVVYPSLEDREVICQGVLNPTVYNVADRNSNAPFAQSSWFIRPNIPFDAGSHDTRILGQNEGVAESNYTRESIVDNEKNINNGAWAEFRHNQALPSNESRRAEIQNIWYETGANVSPIRPNNSEEEWITNNSNLFYVDQSIVTLNSPDIEFNSDIQKLDLSSAKLRIVGFVPLTANIGDINIGTAFPSVEGIVAEIDELGKMKKKDIGGGLIKETIGTENNLTKVSWQGSSQEVDYLGKSYYGYRKLMSGAFWIDNVFTDDKEVYQSPARYIVYPWHRSGSLNNSHNNTVDKELRSTLSKKRISNLCFSCNSSYFKNGNTWNPTRGISGAQIFNSDEIVPIKIAAPKDSELNDIIYYGNIDKISTSSYWYNINASATVGLEDGEVKYTFPDANEISKHSTFIMPYVWIRHMKEDDLMRSSKDPVSIKYKSSSHAVMALNYTLEHKEVILPTIKDEGISTINSRQCTYAENYYPFWGGSSRGVAQDTISDSWLDSQIDREKGIQYGWLWLGELYRDNITNRFGGQTEEAIENNLWLPCGNTVDLLESNGLIKLSVKVKWTEGDTYYQRYDCLKTYPFTFEDDNQVTEIVSFMCETRVNLDGRYDRNRGQLSNITMSPTNFNLLNPVYSQSNNFFTYRALNSNKLTLDNFHNTISWSKAKTSGELIDSWTSPTLLSTLDLDGDKGPIRSINRLNNNLIAFQDRGISQILFNENQQLVTAQGIPVELANSGKVNGKRYFTDKVGCTNKWSICETPLGIYFIDDITKNIFLFNGELSNLSDRLGFNSWIKSNSKSLDIWNPIDFNNFITYYDKVKREVLFISKDSCLAFSEPLGQFSSFYSYEKTPYFTNINDRGVMVNTSYDDSKYKIWLHNEGDYNSYFGKYEPFYTTIIVNPDMPMDKIFNTVEFRADSWNNDSLLDSTFDTLDVWNEYQEGHSDLSTSFAGPSNLKRKFRIWRANIPRSSSGSGAGRDRMRNPWLYLKLSMNSENTNKTILHDITVNYFE